MSLKGLKAFLSAAGNVLDGQQCDKKLTTGSGIKSLIVSSEIKSSPVIYWIKSFLISSR
jgi:hypothetical protein